jgi:hypothetical protein
VEFVSMMEMARDHRAGGNLVNVCDHLFVGDTNKIAFSKVRSLVSCEPALLLAEYKRDAVARLPASARNRQAGTRGPAIIALSRWSTSCADQRGLRSKAAATGLYTVNAATLAGGSHAPHTNRTFPGNHRSFADGERHPECRRDYLSLVCQLPGSLHHELRLYIPETVLSDAGG